MVPKLKYEHLYLSSFSKMRVDLAVQVCMIITCIYGIPLSNNNDDKHECFVSNNHN